MDPMVKEIYICNQHSKKYKHEYGYDREYIGLALEEAWEVYRVCAEVTGDGDFDDDLGMYTVKDALQFVLPNGFPTNRGNQ